MRPITHDEALKRWNDVVQSYKGRPGVDEWLMVADLLNAVRAEALEVATLACESLAEQRGERYVDTRNQAIGALDCASVVRSLKVC
jgi:hypothetical protein